MNLKIAVLTPNPFPIGNVATSRFSTYAKALASETCYVKVVVLKATEIAGATNNETTTGTIDNVHYEYMSRTTIWNQKANKARKLAHYIYGVLRAAALLKRERINTVVMYTNDPFYILFFGLYSKIFSINIYIDKSEYPVVFYKRRSLYKTLYIKLFKLFDGIIVMTNELQAYYSSIKSREAKCFYLPMSVDIRRFESIKKSPFVEPYVACVFGVHNRDCILDTIRAFSLFKANTHGCNTKLYLIGDFANLKDREPVEEYLAANRAIASEIVFSGNLSSTSIPHVLVNAECLITTPRSYKSGGFPTKLGEYLATGNPVVATSAGEISLFLTHLDNCLLARPGDIVEIAKNLELIAVDKACARAVGAKGRELVKGVFNAQTHVTDLMRFLRNEYV